jgi:hypothetical protein
MRIPTPPRHWVILVSSYLCCVVYPDCYFTWQSLRTSGTLRVYQDHGWILYNCSMTIFEYTKLVPLQKQCVSWKWLGTYSFVLSQYLSTRVRFMTICRSMAMFQFLVHWVLYSRSVLYLYFIRWFGTLDSWSLHDNVWVFYDRSITIFECFTFVL